MAKSKNHILFRFLDDTKSLEKGGKRAKKSMGGVQSAARSMAGTLAVAFGAREIVQFASTLNPAFPKEEFDKALKTMPRWKFDLFYRGQYTKPAGLIYDSFDERACKIPRRDLPREWPRYMGLDFGGVNMAALWYAQDPGTGYIYVYREYLSGGKAAGDHAREFKELSRNEDILKVCGGSHQEQGWRDAFTAAGWHVIEPSEPAVEVGIDNVYAWHKLNKLFVFDDLEMYLDEKMSYSWELDDSYNPVTGKIDSKSSFHFMDAERYIVSDFAPPGGIGGRSNVVKVVNWATKRDSPFPSLRSSLGLAEVK